MEERWAAEERWALRHIGFIRRIRRAAGIAAPLQSGPPSDRRPMVQSGPPSDERRNLRSIRVSRVTSWRSSASSGATSSGATSDGATRGATSGATSEGHRPLHLLRPVAQKKRHPVLPGAVRQIPLCAGKRSAVTSASTERRTHASDPLCARAGVTKPRAGVAAQSADDALCAPGAEPSPTSIMELILMAKVAEAKAGKAPRPAARTDSAPITAPRPAARVHPAPIAAPRPAARADPVPITAPRPARAGPVPQKNHEKKSLMNVTGTCSATQHNNPKKVTEGLKGISVRAALNQPSLPLPPPPALAPPPDSLVHQKGNMPRGYFMRLRKM